MMLAQMLIAGPLGRSLHRYDPNPHANFAGIDGDAVLSWARWWDMTFPTNTGIYKGQRARIEHVLHEAAHALSLRIALPCAVLEKRIAKRLDPLPLPAQRHNEGLVLAAELGLLTALGNDPDLYAYQDNADRQGCLPELEALRGGALAAALGRKLLRWLEHGEMLTHPA